MIREPWFSARSDSNPRSRLVDDTSPTTVVTFLDEDGEEFPVRLPGVYREYRAADIAAAFQILTETEEATPNGKVGFYTIEYFNEE